MTTKSFEEFTDKFLSNITSKFINVKHKVTVTINTIKITVYFPEDFEEIDIRALYAICNDETKKNIAELEAFNFDKILFFSFDGEKGKVTIKWLKILDKD